MGLPVDHLEALDDGSGGRDRPLVTFRHDLVDNLARPVSREVPHLIEGHLSDHHEGEREEETDDNGEHSDSPGGDPGTDGAWPQCAP
ncbi:hypothetical protein GCM10028793_59110 [Nocardiopsis oceani]